MKKTVLTAFAAVLWLGAAAEETLRIELNDGSVTTIAVSDIREMNFGESDDAPTGDYTGDITVAVGGMFTYEARDVVYTLREGADGSISVDVPAYSLAGTVMGDLSIGAYTIDGLTFDSASGCYVRDYGDDGLTVHMTAEKDGSVTMDGDYSFNSGSNISVEFSEGSVRIVNSFRPGAMPFELTSTFEGSR